MSTKAFYSKFEQASVDESFKAILEIQAEIFQRAGEIFALYFDSLAGYDKLTKDMVGWKHDVARNLKEQFGTEIDEKTWEQIEPLRSNPPHGKWSRFPEFAKSLTDYRLRLVPEGRNAALIGNYLLIALYQFWEDSWRSRIAAVFKCEKNEVKSDFWGDLRLMRQCLIHAGGVADSDVEKKTVLLRWFKRGEPILISPEKVEVIIEGIFGFAYGELLQCGEKLKS